MHIAFLPIAPVHVSVVRISLVRIGLVDITSAPIIRLCIGFLCMGFLCIRFLRIALARLIWRLAFAALLIGRFGAMSGLAFAAWRGALLLVLVWGGVRLRERFGLGLASFSVAPHVTWVLFRKTLGVFALQFFGAAPAPA